MDYGIVKIDLSVLIPTEVISKGKNQIAIFLTDKLMNDPYFFREFNQEEIQIVTDDIHKLAIET